MTSSNMTVIQVEFLTMGQARQAYLDASLSPYTVDLVEHPVPHVLVGSCDTSAASLVAWFAENHGGQSFHVVSDASEGGWEDEIRNEIMSRIPDEAGRTTRKLVLSLVWDKVKGMQGVTLGRVAQVFRDLLNEGALIEHPKTRDDHLSGWYRPVSLI